MSSLIPDLSLSRWVAISLMMRIALPMLFMVFCMMLFLILVGCRWKKIKLSI